MIRTVLAALAMLAAPTVATAQDAPRLLQLELGSSGKGYAVILDGEGNEHHCVARETRESVDLGPCKPLRLVTPLSRPRAEIELPSMPTMSPAKRSVVDLFERNRCALTYVDLKRALESLGARQRQTIGQTVAEMTERGEIADDAVRERAVLKIGDRCA
jgi:hypothetical protein